MLPRSLLLHNLLNRHGNSPHHKCLRIHRTDMRTGKSFRMLSGATAFARCAHDIIMPCNMYTGSHNNIIMTQRQSTRRIAAL